MTLLSPNLDTLDEALRGVECSPRFGEKWMSTRLGTFVSGNEHTVVCVGDSTVEGVGGYDYWPMQLARLLARFVSGGLGAGVGSAGLVTTNANGSDDYGGFQHMDKPEWAKGADYALIGSGSVKDMAPFGLGYECLVGGTAAAQTATWTRPTQLSLDRFDLMWVDVNTAGSVGWSYSTNGGGAWTDVAVTNPGTATLKTVSVNVTNPADIRIRAATAAGAASRIPAILGIVVYDDTANVNTDKVALHNFGRSSNFLITFARSSSGDPYAVPKYLLTHQALGNTHGLVIIGPFTNDVLLGVSADDYAAALQTLADQFSPTSDLLFIGAFEQQGVETYPGCRLTAGSPNVTVPDGGLDSTKDNGRGVTGIGVPGGATISSVTDSTHFVLSANATQSGTPALTFAGRDVDLQAAHRSAARDVALANDAAYLDLKAAWGPFRTAWQQGFMDGGIHQSQKGHTDIAHRVARLLRTLS